MLYAIDNNVPVSNAALLNDGKGRACKYPWANMAVGDSFFVADTQTLASGIRAAQLRTGFRFIQSREGGGVRVWRVEGSTPIREREPATSPVPATPPKPATAAQTPATAAGLPRVRRKPATPPEPATAAPRRRLTATPPDARQRNP